MKMFKPLGYLGLTPFIICFLLSLLVAQWKQIGIQAFIFYSAIILSFLSGTLWLKSDDNNNAKQQIISNLICLMAFFSLLLAHSVALITLALGYLVIFIFEKHLYSKNPKLADYLNMRFKLTLCVIFLHSFTFITVT